MRIICSDLIWSEKKMFVKFGVKILQPMDGHMARAVWVDVLPGSWRGQLGSPLKAAGARGVARRVGAARTRVHAHATEVTELPWSWRWRAREVVRVDWRLRWPARLDWSGSTARLAEELGLVIGLPHGSHGFNLWDFSTAFKILQDLEKS